MTSRERSTKNQEPRTPARVLVVSVHPDDETLGCGGTLLAHRAAGDELHWLIITAAYAPRWDQSVIDAKSDEVQQVADAYGMASRHWLGHEATRLDQVDQARLMEEIRDVMATVRPSTVYCVHGGDVHSDHRYGFEAVMAVLKPFHMAALGVERILCFETLSSTEAASPIGSVPFVPTVFHDVSDHLEQKLALMALFKSETQPDPMPRGLGAIRALARYRGATIGVEYAEAFMLVRERVRVKKDVACDER